MFDVALLALGPPKNVLMPPLRLCRRIAETRSAFCMETMFNFSVLARTLTSGAGNAIRTSSKSVILLAGNQNTEYVLSVIR